MVEAVGLEFRVARVGFPWTANRRRGGGDDLKVRRWWRVLASGRDKAVQEHCEPISNKVLIYNII
jgi:hypothetical protein